MLFHRGDERARKTCQRHRDCAVGGDRLGKPLLDDIIRRRLAWINWHIALPQRLFQERCESDTKTRGDLVAAACSDIADGFQPGTAQPARDRIIRPQREHRQRRNSF
jgi:hypothetical protein